MPFIEMLIRIAPKGENNCIIKIVPTFNDLLATCDIFEIRWISLFTIFKFLHIWNT